MLNAPWRAVPHEALLSLRTLGFAASLADIVAVCEAALLHEAVTNAGVHSAWRVYDDALASDDVALAVANGGTFALPWHRRHSIMRDVSL